MSVRAEFNVSTAFYKVTATWKNIAKYKSDCVFALPTNGTVTEVSIKIKNRSFESVIVPNNEAAEVVPGEKKTEEEVEEELEGKLPPMDFNEYFPNLFRLPISGVNSTDLVTVSVLIIESLPFSEGSYKWTLPLTFTKNLMAKNAKVSDILSIRCIVNSVNAECTYACDTHATSATLSPAGSSIVKVTDFVNVPEIQKRVEKYKKKYEDELEAGKVFTSGYDPLSKVPCSTDFTLTYSMDSTEILTSLIQAPAEGEESESSFLLFLTPPSFGTFADKYKKCYFFLLDRSGSMGGEPYNEAIRALLAALKTLKADDTFVICAFDHRQEYFPSSKKPVVASPGNVQDATDWVAKYKPERGGTDIFTPLKYALTVTEEYEEKKGDMVMPFIFLLTDGAVADERNIAQLTQSKCKRTRVLTLGIGTYCNWFFLKILSEIGRGFSDVVVYKERIFSQVTGILEAASVPLLTNLAITIPDVQNVELYPFPIPDLFQGGPLTIAGSFTGSSLPEVTISGLDFEGKETKIVVRARESDVIPVRQVAVKQRLDLLTARAWLSQSKKMEEKVTELSVEDGIVSPYTQMVTLETSGTPLATMDDEPPPDLEDDEFIDEPIISTLKKSKDRKRKWYKNKKVLMGVVAGNAILIGAALFHFGDVAATLGNSAALDGLGDMFSGGDCGCDCGDCDCADCLVC